MQRMTSSLHRRYQNLGDITAIIYFAPEDHLEVVAPHPHFSILNLHYGIEFCQKHQQEEN